MTKLIVVDCETTGLDPERHEVWDIAMQEITPRAETVGAIREWHPSPRFLGNADSMSLRMNRYYKRVGSSEWRWTLAVEAAREIAGFIDGAILLGTNTKFDIAFIEKFLRKNGQCPAWDYHDLDVSNLIIGFDLAMGGGAPYDKPAGNGELPTFWKSTDLSKLVGVDPDQFDRHTARGDVEWAVAQLQAMVQPKEA